MKKETAFLAGFIILKFVLQYVLISPVYELHRDEFLHIDQGNHLSWGYFSVPPFTSWIAWLILQLGGGEFWVKLFPAAFGALTLLVVWQTVKALGGNLFALVLSATAVLLSVLLRINLLFQPNSFDILAWTFTYFCILKFIQTEKNKWLYAAAVGTAFGFLNKYNIAFLIAGLLPALLLSPYRKIFTSKHLYFALGIGLIIILPNLYWQYTHSFPVIDHMNELARTQLVNVDRTDFIKEQLLFFIGSIFVIVAAFIALLIYYPFKKYRLLLFSFIITLAVFIYLKAKGYYAIGLYPVFLAFGAVYIEHLTRKKWTILWRSAAIIIPVLLFLPMIDLVFPVKTPQHIEKNNEEYKDMGLLRWEDGKDHLLPQDFADMLGWKEMAEKTQKAFELLPGKDTTLILCDNYGQAGAINYYSKNPGIQALSFNADYPHWFPPEIKFTNVILVKDDTDEDIDRNIERPLFQSVSLFDSVQHPYARERGSRIYILRKALPVVNERLKKELESVKH